MAEQKEEGGLELKLTIPDEQEKEGEEREEAAEDASEVPKDAEPDEIDEDYLKGPFVNPGRPVSPQMEEIQLVDVDTEGPEVDPEPEVAEKKPNKRSVKR